jgi:hypothetical protein
MSMTWFKLHHEIIDDIKIRRFSAQEKWAWIVLLSLASKSSDRGKITADNEDLADYCEFNSTQDWLYYRDKLIIKGMLEINSTGGLTIIHWDDRQAKKPSDDPTRVKERVAKSRAKRKSETVSQSQEDVTRYKAIQAECNADVTTQTRSDQSRSEEIRSEDLFLRAQEKKMKASCKIEISLPEEKKETIALEDKSENQDPTPLNPPAPQNLKFIDPYQRAMDVRQREPEVKKMMDDREFLKFLIPLMKRWDAYKTSCDSSDARKWVRVAIEPKNDKCDSRWDESRDRYKDFLDQQTQRSQQQPAPIAVQELTATAPPAHIRERFKTA